MKNIKTTLFTILVFSFIIGSSNKIKELENKQQTTKEEVSSLIKSNLITANSLLSAFSDRKTE